MDNPLTPNKIQRLMHLAEDKSFSLPKKMLLGDVNLKLKNTPNEILDKSFTTSKCESSSGILDLDKVDGFGESGLGNFSLSKSTAFNPGEMTGRSTGAEDIKPMCSDARNFEDCGRFSITIDSLTSNLDKQTNEIRDLMRHSIASNYSFHSKRDLTADEVSLVMREAPLPIVQTTQAQFNDTMASQNNVDLSVGAYFKNRCPDLGNVLWNSNSPNRSERPSISEVSSTTHHAQDANNTYKLDQTLDSVPIKQPRNPSEKQNTDYPQSSRNIEKQIFATPKLPERSKMHKQVERLAEKKNPNSSQKSFMSSKKPTDYLLKNLQSSMRLMSEETGGESTADASLSISRIADYLGKQSNISISDILQQLNQVQKPPLSERQMNIQQNKCPEQEVKVTLLKDTKKTETASSSNSVNTVISLDKLNINQENVVPQVIVTRPTLETGSVKSERARSRSKSPSSKSHSTLTTVQENCTSFKSSESPMHSSKGEVNTSRKASPNVVYKELDKSVDWQALLQQKKMKEEGFAKDWVEIITTPVNGFVGVCCPVNIVLITLSDSWLTANFELHNPRNDISIDLPRLPILLSPGKTENFTFHVTSNSELNTTIPFKMTFKDASINCEIEQTGHIEINLQMPSIQAVSNEEVNKVSFPPIQEKTSLTKAIVLLSDCPVDLQLELSVAEGESMFAVKGIQAIKKSDVSKVLMDKQVSLDEPGKSKSKALNKQVCRLNSGNAIKVTIAFNAPELYSSQSNDYIMKTINGKLNIKLIGVDTVLKIIDLSGHVGTVKLDIQAPKKIHLTREPTAITVANLGSLPGTWIAKLSTTHNTLFKVSPIKFDIRPSATKIIELAYMGPEDVMTEATIIFEDLSSGTKTPLEVAGGSESQKSFPIKTNHSTMSWVRNARKELSLRNASDKKIHIRCKIVGDGFVIDMPGAETRGMICLPFLPNETRPLPILFSPNSAMPYSATLHLVYDKTSDHSRRVRLFGCSSGDCVRWSGLVTYGNTALVRAVYKSNIDLKLYNKSPTQAFISAKVNFNLQFLSLDKYSSLTGGRTIIPGRSHHTVSLRVDWSKVEKKARELPNRTPALATVAILSGANTTRKRILKVLRDQTTMKIDTSLLPENLKVLTEEFVGDDNVDNLSDFQETKNSLDELIGGLQELTAQIDLPQDFAEESTIVITDDTVIEHHTLRD